MIIKIIVGSIAGIIFGYQLKNLLYMLREKKIYKQCEYISKQLEDTTSCIIEKDKMENDLREKLEKEQIVYKELDKYIEGVK